MLISIGSYVVGSMCNPESWADGKLGMTNVG